MLHFLLQCQHIVNISGDEKKEIDDTISSGIVWNIPYESLEFSRYTYEPLGDWVYRENAIGEWDVP